MKTRILLADDHVLVRQALRLLLEKEGFEVVGEAADGESAVREVQLLQPDVVQVANTQVDNSRTVTIELDANSHNLPWSFRPLVRHLTVHPGEVATVEYEIANVRSEAVTAQAVPSYGPARAAEHFRKMECFCFTQQTLGPGETRRFPVVFVVDPKLPRDVNTITLSYTFFEVAGRGGRT